MLTLACDGLVAELDPVRAEPIGLYFGLEDRARSVPLIWPAPRPVPRPVPRPAEPPDGFEILDRSPLSARFVRTAPSRPTRRFELEPGALRIGLGSLSPDAAAAQGDREEIVLELARCPFSLGDRPEVGVHDGALLRLQWTRHTTTLTLRAAAGRLELRSDLSIDDPYIAVALRADDDGAAEASLEVEGGPARLDGRADAAEDLS